MALNVAQIHAAKSDEDLLRLLMSELNVLFPQELRKDRIVFLSRLQTAPPGLRAMAATFDLDVSMALDDLAWHFVNHHDLDLYEETLSGLRELGAVEAAELFAQTFSIFKPFWRELGEVAEKSESKSFHDWLDETGIQKRTDPLSDRMWKLLCEWRELGLFHYWLTYARQHPQQCVVSSIE